MNIKHYALILTLILLCFTTTKAQQNIKLSLYEDTSQQLNANSIYRLYQQGKFTTLTKPAFNPGYTESIYWIAIKNPNNAPNLLLVIDNPHINLLDWYQVNLQTNQPKLLYQTGDFLPFKSRPYKEFRGYAFPINNDSTINLLKVDKKKESLQTPMRILTYNQLATSDIQENLITGFLSGIVIIMVFFAFVLWINTRKKVYLFYALYISSLLFWIWSNEGLGFQYLWPNSNFFPSRARPTTLLLNIIFSIQFLQHFIGQTQKSFFYYPNKLLQLASVIYLILVLWPIDYQKSIITVKNTQDYFTVLATLQSILIFTSLIEKMYKGVTEAYFYLAGILILATAGVAQQLYIYGAIFLNHYVAQFGVLLGLAIEAGILLFGLAIKFSKYRKQNTKLLLEKSEQQKMLTETIVDVQEKERKLLADKLHDEIGAMLSVVGLHVNTLQQNLSASQTAQLERLTKADEMLSEISTTVRKMSHQLSPVTIEKLGIVKAIEDLIKNINTSEKLYIEFVCLGFEEPKLYPSNYLNSIYRIVQEILQNMIKHAQATNGIIQIIEHADIIAIMAEDNGVGITNERLNNPKGSQLNSLYSKIEYLQGNIEIETPKTGTIINIEIPNKKNTVKSYDKN